MLYKLHKKVLAFPDPRFVDNANGEFAFGGDISPERMRIAYSWGILPWYPWREEEPVWFCPMQRFVIIPEEVHVSHSMRTLLNKNLYQFSINRDFEGVIRNCSKGGRDEDRMDHPLSWLGEEMIKTMLQLHESGEAMSVEVWDKEGVLVGGLYGVVSGAIFCGESMFSKVPSGSKLALIALCRYIEQDKNKQIGIRLIDCQFETPHLKSMGGKIISYAEYLSYNFKALPPLHLGPAILT